MSYIRDALNAVTGMSISAKEEGEIEAWMIEHDILPPHVDYVKRAKRENERYNRDRKAAADAQYNAAPIYTGAVEHCMACVFPSRGAPYRCMGGGRLRIVRARHGEKPLAVCYRHAHDTSVGEYTGWAGNPNPKLDVLEREEVAKLP